MIIVALGANLPSGSGPPAETLRQALAVLRDNNIIPELVSHLYRTEAWPDPNDPPFINAVASVRTPFEPVALIACLHKVEALFGRRRQARNAPRTLDLDLIDYNGRIQNGLPILPHPRMETRGFVLVPLLEIAPDWRHPVSGLPVRELVASLPEKERNIAPL